MCVRYEFRFAFYERRKRRSAKERGQEREIESRTHSKTKSTKMSTEGNIKIDGFFFNASNVAQNGWKGG